MQGVGGGEWGAKMRTHIFRHVAFAPDDPGAVAPGNCRCSEVSSSHMVLCEGHVMRARHGPMHAELLHDASVSKPAVSQNNTSQV